MAKSPIGGLYRLIDSSLSSFGMRKEHVSLPVYVPDSLRFLHSQTLAGFRAPFMQIDFNHRLFELLMDDRLQKPSIPPDSPDRFLSSVPHLVDMSPLRDYWKGRGQNRPSQGGPAPGQGKMGNISHKAVSRCVKKLKPLGKALRYVPGVQSLFLPQVCRCLIGVENYRNSLGDARFQMVITELDSLFIDEEDEKADVFELRRQLKYHHYKSQAFYNGMGEAELAFPLASSAGLPSIMHRVFESISPQKHKKLRRYKTPWGSVAIGSRGPDVFTDGDVIIIDPGGDDRYLFNRKSEFRAIFDRAGDDLYVDGGYGLAAGILGTGILLDMSGNDKYICTNGGLGLAYFGFGFLLDAGGRDLYQIGKFGQGAGAFGIGILADLSGNDHYASKGYAQGFGFTLGLGLLYDKSGQDVYSARAGEPDEIRQETHSISFSQGASLGARPFAAGGLGYLVDARGDDVYLSDIFGQGVAYWFGLGGLLDGAGDDHYVSYQYTQGAGVHFGHGFLWDRSGSDKYIAHGVSQGCGHDFSSGFLIDGAGHDWYGAHGLSQGGGNGNSLSLFMDVRGDDKYLTSRDYDVQGFSDFRRGLGFLGVFIDAGGKDRITGEAPFDSLRGQTGFKSTYGIRRFFEFNHQEYHDTHHNPKKPDSGAVPLTHAMDSLFIQASTSAEKYFYNVEPARQKILQYGTKGVPYMISLLGTPFSREIKALRDIFTRIAESDDTATKEMLEQALRDSLKSQRAEVVAQAVMLCGKAELPRCLEKFPGMVRHPALRIRIQIYRALAKAGTGREGLQPLFEGGLRDSNLSIRAFSAFGAGRLVRPDSLQRLLKELKLQISESPETNYLVLAGLLGGLSKNAMGMPDSLRMEGVIKEKGNVLPWCAFPAEKGDSTAAADGEAGEKLTDRVQSFENVMKTKPVPEEVKGLCNALYLRAVHE